jgi:hypothetical protein
MDSLREFVSHSRSTCRNRAAKRVVFVDLKVMVKRRRLPGTNFSARGVAFIDLDQMLHL